MKKNLAFSSAMFLVVIFAAFADGGGRGMHEDGLAIGFEFGFRNAENSDFASSVQPYLRYYIAYGQEFSGDPLGIFDTIGLIAEMDITTAFANRGEETENSLWFYMELSFDRQLNDDTTLTFLMEKEIYDLMLTAREENRPNMTAIIGPGVMLARELGSGDKIFAAINAPITYLDMFYIPNPNAPPDYIGATWMDSRRAYEIGLGFTFGWESTFGLGIEVTLESTIAGISPWVGDRGITGMKIWFAYEWSRFFLGLDFEITRGAGVGIAPLISVNVGRFEIYAYMEFAYLGPPAARDSHRPETSAAVGVRWTVFSFD